MMSCVLDLVTRSYIPVCVLVCGGLSIMTLGPVKLPCMPVSAPVILFIWVLIPFKRTVSRPCRVRPIVAPLFLMSSTCAWLVSNAVNGSANRLELEHKLYRYVEVVLLSLLRIKDTIRLANVTGVRWRTR